MLLATLQDHLSCLYEAPIEQRVADYLVTDAQVAQALEDSDKEHANCERLLVREGDDSLDISLYIDAQILANLSACNPYTCLDERNLNQFLIALEGVSHFHYLVWNAVHARQVTQLELELQAEVDKYVTVTLLLRQQGVIDDSEEFHERFFTAVSYVVDGTCVTGQRYREANHYAAKYCRGLNRRYPAQHEQPTFINELRRFYRRSQNEKIRSIERTMN
jgi:hypothetical protein